MMLSRGKSWAQCLGQNHPVYRLEGMERRIESMARRKLSHLSVTRKKLLQEGFFPPKQQHQDWTNCSLPLTPSLGT